MPERIPIGADHAGFELKEVLVAELERRGRSHGLKVTQVPPVFFEGERVSSTAVRGALGRGDLATATGMLGRYYSISGRVVRGLGLGRKLGFPTANVDLRRLQTPIDGIFAARVRGLPGGVRSGVASVGTRPTIGGRTALLEVLIFDFDADIYGEYITVEFVRRLREERHFPDLAAMQRQMHVDVDAARAVLAE
jgi:riboflavin kinase/FMN adenylyltransferase